MINLSNKEERLKLEEQIENEIDEYCVKLYDDGEHRKHLGASIIGDPCSRQLWYTFRWCKRQTFEGRMHRLFNVGNDAEPRFATYLKGIGFEVITHQALILCYHAESDEYFFQKVFDAGDGLISDVNGIPEHEAIAAERGLKRPQFRMSGINGHYGGSVDAILKAPARYNLSKDLIFLGEFKTSNTARFPSVEKEGVAKAKPQHYAQACQYGYKFNLDYCLYLIENKNDSDITIKIFEIDKNYGRALEKKAEDIINSATPPAKISENPSYFECKYCEAFNGICHNNEPVDINCRSCRFAQPVENRSWYCHRWQSIIPEAEIIKGCPAHASINEVE